MDEIPERKKFLEIQQLLTTRREVLTHRWIECSHQVQRDIGSGIQPFLSTTQLVPLSNRNPSAIYFECDQNSIEQSDPEILRTLSGHNFAHQRRSALTQMRLALNQHAAQSVAYVHAAQKSMQVSIKNATQTLINNGAEEEMDLTKQKSNDTEFSTFPNTNNLSANCISPHQCIISKPKVQ